MDITKALRKSEKKSSNKEAAKIGNKEKNTEIVGIGQ